MIPWYNISKEVLCVSKWDKLIQQILKKNKDLRFADLAKALTIMGYTQYQPNGGSSHYTFRKNGCMLWQCNRHTPMNKVYIDIVKDIVQEYLDVEV